MFLYEAHPNMDIKAHPDVYRAVSEKIWWRFSIMKVCAIAKCLVSVCINCVIMHKACHSKTAIKDDMHNQLHS